MNPKAKSTSGGRSSGNPKGGSSSGKASSSASASGSGRASPASGTKPGVRSSPPAGAGKTKLTTHSKPRKAPNTIRTRDDSAQNLSRETVPVSAPVHPVRDGPSPARELDLVQEPGQAPTNQNGADRLKMAVRINLAQISESVISSTLPDSGSQRCFGQKPLIQLPT